MRWTIFYVLLGLALLALLFSVYQSFVLRRLMYRTIMVLKRDTRLTRAVLFETIRTEIPRRHRHFLKRSAPFILERLENKQLIDGDIDNLHLTYQGLEAAKSFQKFLEFTNLFSSR